MEFRSPGWNVFIQSTLSSNPLGKLSLWKACHAMSPFQVIRNPCASLPDTKGYNLRAWIRDEGPWQIFDILRGWERRVFALQFLYGTLQDSAFMKMSNYSFKSYIRRYKTLLWLWCLNLSWPLCWNGIKAVCWVPALCVLGRQVSVYHQPLWSVTFRGDCAHCRLTQ